jgi:hypothetical protein
MLFQRLPRRLCIVLIHLTVANKNFVSLFETKNIPHNIMVVEKKCETL